MVGSGRSPEGAEDHRTDRAAQIGFMTEKDYNGYAESPKIAECAVVC